MAAGARCDSWFASSCLPMFGMVDDIERSFVCFCASLAAWDGFVLACLQFNALYWYYLFLPRVTHSLLDLLSSSAL